MYRVEHQIKITASLDADKRQVGFARTADANTITVREDPTEGHAETRVVVAGAADEALAFGGVAIAKVLYIESDQAITVKINGGAEVFKLTPTTGKQAKLFWEGEITGLAVTNPSITNDAIVTYLVAG
jgi:hypothetical protein